MRFFFSFEDDLTQTSTVTRLPGQKVQVQVDVQNIRDMKIHITNILYGKKFLESILDRIINDSWQPGFMLTRGLINELVSKAFTEIFDNSFHDFPFERIFRPKEVISTTCAPK